jgi:cob(I)alamin adenosyltransferase
MKIYTKSGDDGTTSLFDGSRVGKDNERVSVYGEIDELNAYLGLVVAHLPSTAEVLQKELQEVQKSLFALGAKLANPRDKAQKDKADFTEEKILFLEKAIDKMEESLKPMTSFILPGGTLASASLHIARTVCRRAERHLIHLHHHEELNDIYLKFVNRLSDYLFVCARYANHLESVSDIEWA